MELKFEQGNLFSVDMTKYKLVQCISSDCKLGAGIAVDFEKNFQLREGLLSLDEYLRRHPQCLYYKGIFNLVTKERAWDKPTYADFTESLRIMRRQCERLDIHNLAMPKIGCGKDRLRWIEVQRILGEVFGDTDINILVRYI